MKTTNLALANLIFSANFFDFDLYTIVMANGTELRFTTADFPIFASVQRGIVTQGAATYGTTPFVDQMESKTQAHWKIGFDTDQWVVVLMPRPFDPITGIQFPDTVNGVPFLQAAQGGMFDAADFQVDRAYFKTIPTWGGTLQPLTSDSGTTLTSDTGTVLTSETAGLPGTITAKGAVPVGTVTIFAGVVMQCDTTSSICVITANDYKSLLTYTMPRHYYEAQCRHTLFDGGCQLNQANYAIIGTIGAGSTQGIIAPNFVTGFSSIMPSSGTFTLGTITMTSGQNATFSRTITNYASNLMTLVNPFPFPLAVGDSFVAYPGCNKTITACAQFANSANFGGQPWIPAPELASS